MRSLQNGSTRRWRAARARQLRAEPCCQMCLAAGRLSLATEVDHITSTADGGSMWDKANHQSLCHSHHAIKTASENGIREHGQPNRAKAPIDPRTGMPLPGFGHPWAPGGGSKV